jgi:hypothetical protein
MLQLEQHIRERAGLTPEQTEVVMSAIQYTLEGCVRRSASEVVQAYAAGVKAAGETIRKLEQRVALNTPGNHPALVGAATASLREASGLLDQAAVRYLERMRQEGVLIEEEQ